MLVRNTTQHRGHWGTLLRLLAHSLGHWRAGSWLLMEKCLKPARTRDGNIINKDWLDTAGQQEGSGFIIGIWWPPWQLMSLAGLLRWWRISKERIKTGHYIAFLLPPTQSVNKTLQAAPSQLTDKWQRWLWRSTGLGPSLPWSCRVTSRHESICC